MNKAIDDFEMAARDYQELIDMRSEAINRDGFSVHSQEVLKFDKQLMEAQKHLGFCRKAIVELYEQK